MLRLTHVILNPPYNPPTHTHIQVQEPMRLLLALVRTLRPRTLLRPYARRFVQQLCYLLLGDGQAASPPPPPPKENEGTVLAGTAGQQSVFMVPSSASPVSSSLLEGESLTAALAVVGELAVVSPEDLRPYVDLLMPR